MDTIKKSFEESIKVKQEILDGDCLNSIARMGKVICESIRGGGKLLLCGNGGSAADAQHLAAELLVRLRPMNNRQAIPAIALAMDPSTFTATGNDFSFESLFERMVQAFGRPGDVLLGISTSGKSENVNLACIAARAIGMPVLAFTGSGGGKMLGLVD
ncbi:MAG: SIS domain-containing protein, partial [Leptospiraceae bacterium]|nr:SIS domain-containing protein [Leptospiraceae bacterium]